VCEAAGILFISRYLNPVILPMQMHNINYMIIKSATKEMVWVELDKQNFFWVLESSVHVVKQGLWLFI